MNKLIILFFAFFCITPCFSQDDATADIVAAIALNGYTEWEGLKAVADKQEEVHASVKDIAYKTAVMVVMKNKYLNSLKDANPLLEKGLFFLEMIKTGEDIIKYQDLSIEAAKNYPDIFDKATVNHVKITLSLIGILADVELAFIQSDENLIDDVDRMDIMDLVNEDLLTIKKVSYQMYANIKALIATEQYENTEIDFSGLLNDMETAYDQLFPENINEDN